jgi:NTE family protein
VLNQAGIEVDLLVGCSGGSLFATTMALGYNVEECIELTQRLWNRSITRKRDTRSLLKALLPGMFKFDERFGMIDDHAMLENLRAVFGERTFAETVVPLHLLATDFHTGEPVISIGAPWWMPAPAFRCLYLAALVLVSDSNRWGGF